MPSHITEAQAESELRSILIAPPEYVKDTYVDLLEACLRKLPETASADAAIAHLEARLAPALGDLVIARSAEHEGGEPAFRIVALAGDPASGLVCIDLRYRAKSRTIAFTIPVALSLPALVACMQCNGAASFDDIRAHAEHALKAGLAVQQRAAAEGWRSAILPTAGKGVFTGNVTGDCRLVMSEYCADAPLPPARAAHGESTQ